MSIVQKHASSKFIRKTLLWLDPHHLISTPAIWDVCLWAAFATLSSPAPPKNNSFECSLAAALSPGLPLSSDMMVVLLWLDGFFPSLPLLAHMEDGRGRREDEPWQFLDASNQSFARWSEAIILLCFAILYKTCSSQSACQLTSIGTHRSTIRGSFAKLSGVWWFYEKQQGKLGLTISRNITWLKLVFLSPGCHLSVTTEASTGGMWCEN